MLATSWNILSGYSGYFSFGHGAFFGAGVYTTAALAGKLGWPFLWTLPLAAARRRGCSASPSARSCSACARCEASSSRCSPWPSPSSLSTIVAQHAVDGGPGIYLIAVPMPKLAPTAVGRRSICWRSLPRR